MPGQACVTEPRAAAYAGSLGGSRTPAPGQHDSMTFFTTGTVTLQRTRQSYSSVYLALFALVLGCSSRQPRPGDLPPRSTPPPCTDTLVAAGPTVRAPAPRLEAIPPPEGAPRHGVYRLTILVLPTGMVDTARTVIEPPLPPAYDKVFRKRLLQWRFWPATRGDCALEAPFTYTLEFTGGGT
jgi:hypothetical protein